MHLAGGGEMPVLPLTIMTGHIMVYGAYGPLARQVTQFGSTELSGAASGIAFCLGLLGAERLNRGVVLRTSRFQVVRSLECL